MDPKLLDAAQKLAPKAIELRRCIHQYPETGNNEIRTSQLVADTLTELGWEVSRPMGTCVVALLRGEKPGRTIAFRADMDALNIAEATGLDFQSAVPGVMHACGHDFHTAALLGAAMLLTERRDKLCGNVKLLFQPDEEGLGGARRMIEAGCMEDPHVDAVFGAHVDPDLPAGTVGVKYGKMYAASDTFRIVIHGVGCHGATPSDGIDAIAVGAQVVTAIQQLVSRRVSPTDSAVISVGKFHAGTQMNAIADEAVLEGIIRTLGSETRNKMRQWFKDCVNGVCSALGATCEIHMRESYPGIVNDDASVDRVANVARGIFGADAVRVLPSPEMSTEDFGYFLFEAPGAFCKIGVRNAAIGADKPIHSPHFRIDEDAMAYAIALHAAVACDYLK